MNRANICVRVGIFSQLLTERSYLDTWLVPKGRAGKGGVSCYGVSHSEGSWTASLPATGVQKSSHLGASVSSRFHLHFHLKSMQI